ncbi:hypothetical protein F5146DRAFT_1002424 [Armillaria mellea]|nr:hypothetical protein F5146DRAFT_1002424 [Armillaria mellea]
MTTDTFLQDGSRYCIDTIADFIINFLADPHHPPCCTVAYTGALGAINNTYTIKKLRTSHPALFDTILRFLTTPRADSGIRSLEQESSKLSAAPQDRFRFSEVVCLMTCIITLAISYPGQAGKSILPRHPQTRMPGKTPWCQIHSTVGQDTAVRMIWRWIYLHQSIPLSPVFTPPYNTAGSTLNKSVYSIPSFTTQAIGIINKNVDLYRIVPNRKPPEAQKYLDILEQAVDGGDMSGVQSRWGKDSHTLLQVLCKAFDATWGIPLVLNGSLYMNLSRVKQITARLHHTFHLPYDKDVYRRVIVDNSCRMKEQEGGKSVFQLAFDVVIHVTHSDLCQSPGCSEMFTSQWRFQGCGGCKRVLYYSEACQRHAWKLPEAPHRMVCSAVATFADKLTLPASLSLSSSTKIVRDEEVDAICSKEGVTKDEAHMIYTHFVPLGELLIFTKQSGPESALHGKLREVAALVISYKQQVALRAPYFHLRTMRLSVKICHDHNYYIMLIAGCISDLSGYRLFQKDSPNFGQYDHSSFAGFLTQTFTEAVARALRICYLLTTMATVSAPGQEEPLPLPQIRINGSDTDIYDVLDRLHRQQSLDDAYKAAFSETELSKTQKKTDKLLDVIDPLSIMTSYTTFDDWYETNGTAVASATTALGSLSSDAKSIGNALNSYAATAELVMQGLTGLGQVHPFIGVAVLAFKTVVSFDMTRRENNKKVLAVKLQMQDMMIALFHYYLKKGFLAIPKSLFILVSAKTYETRLATYASKFAEHRKGINSALLVHTTLGVESANAKLDVLDENQESIDRKFDEVKDILLVFSKLDTDRDRDIQDFIKNNGGPKVCIDNERLLHELVDKSGEGITGVLGQQSDETWAKAKDKKKLNIQMQKNTESILTALSASAYDRISDDDLRDLWKDMGWKGSSVKARHLILALHDYFTDRLKTPTRSSSPTSMLSPPGFETGSPVRSPISPGYFSLRENTDQWTLAYLNISHLQPILEAVDDDATGFITIKEINTFTNVKSRPQDWTVNRYKKMIRMILSAMYDTFPNVLPANREVVATYLQHRVIYRIDTLLQSTRDVSSNSLESSLQLQKLTEEYTKLEESRIGANLADVLYEIDGRSTMSLVTGRGRIERYIYPVLYLLLRHQLRVIRLSTRFILDPYEIWNMSTSLWNLFSVVEERVQNLASIFKQSNVNIVEKLENFAFGMIIL